MKVFEFKRAFAFARSQNKSAHDGSNCTKRTILTMENLETMLSTNNFQYFLADDVWNRTCALKCEYNRNGTVSDSLSIDGRCFP